MNKEANVNVEEQTIEETDLPKTEETMAEEPKQSDETEQNAPQTITLTVEEFEQVKAHIQGLQKEKEELVNMLQRLQADFDNYRKRNAAIRAESLEEGVRNLTADLLPTLDNFDRAMQSASGVESAWLEGVQMVQRQLLDTLAKNGLKEVPADGKFDPDLHEAVLHEESEGIEPGMICEVFQKGYMVNNRIIRHSMVKVAK